MVKGYRLSAKSSPNRHLRPQRHPGRRAAPLLSHAAQRSEISVRCWWAAPEQRMEIPHQVRDDGSETIPSMV